MRIALFNLIWSILEISNPNKLETMPQIYLNMSKYQKTCDKIGSFTQENIQAQKTDWKVIFFDVNEKVLM